MTTATASPLLTAPLGPTTLRLAAPNMVAMVAMVSLIAEAWFVGQLGTEALAGLALGFPMMMLSAGSFDGTITGAVARRLGAGDRAGAEVVALHAVLLMVLLAGACTLVFLLGGRWIYSLLGGRGPVLAHALAYSDVLFVCCLTMWLAHALAAIERATGHMQVAAKGLVAGSALQVMAAGVLVFGPVPFPRMGIAGAAAGIGIGHAFAAILLPCFLTVRCVELRLRLSGMALTLAPILKVGPWHRSIRSVRSLRSS